MSRRTKQLPKRLSDKRQFWQHHVRRQARGKLTQRNYCERYGLGYASFVRWRGLLEKRRQLQVPPLSVGAFVPVQVETPNEPSRRTVQHDTDAIVLVLPGGLRIEGITSVNIDLAAVLVSRL